MIPVPNPSEMTLDVLAIYLVIAGLGLLLVSGSNRIAPVMLYILTVAITVPAILYAPVLVDLLISLESS